MSLASRVLFALCLGCWSLSEAVAQTAPDAGLPRGFVGVSGALSSEDRSNRMRLYEDERLYAIGVEAGARVNGSFGLGVEWHRPSDAYGSTLVGAGRAEITGLQQEWAGVALLRARLLGSGLAAFDVIAGGGLMRQRHVRGGCQPPAQRRCEQFGGYQYRSGNRLTTGVAARLTW